MVKIIHIDCCVIFKYRLVNRRLAMVGKILFLGYGRSETTLIDSLESMNFRVYHSEKPLEVPIEPNWDLVVSFGYRHILKRAILETIRCPIINLHISYLPWNRGAHPVFWAIHDKTPLGVSIHEIDAGIDTGPIIDQRLFSQSLTGLSFRELHRALCSEVESLFLENLEQLLSRSYDKHSPNFMGSFHIASDLPIDFLGWDSIVGDRS
jgi:methionyl-tRNA formyltransferase